MYSMDMGVENTRNNVMGSRIITYNKATISLCRTKASEDLQFDFRTDRWKYLRGRICFDAPFNVAMSMMQTLSLTVHDNFHPLCSTPATSFTGYLPQGQKANCLLLGSGDPRKILYTLYSEQDNGKSSQAIVLMKGFEREYDLTCCDIEPATLGISWF
jgi:Domain of unknown function (DUF4470)